MLGDMSSEVRQAVIMVGGKGTRLLPLTLTRPKPAMPVLDKPFLKYLIESMADAGIEEIFLACGYKSDVLAHAIGDGSDMGVRIIYSDEDTPLGTGGAIKRLEDRLVPGGQRGHPDLCGHSRPDKGAFRIGGGRHGFPIRGRRPESGRSGPYRRGR